MVYLYSTNKMMHGPINIRFINCSCLKTRVIRMMFVYEKGEVNCVMCIQVTKYWPGYEGLGR